MPKPKPVKITEPVRSARLRRPLKPSVTHDVDTPGLALHVTTQPRLLGAHLSAAGSQSPHRSALGRRRPTRTRRRYDHDRGRSQRRGADGQSASSRRVGAPTTKPWPLRPPLRPRAPSLPQTVDEALDAYTAALMTRRQPSEYTRRKYIHYARKAIRAMKAEPLALAAVTPAIVRVMVETMAGSDGERHLVFRSFSRFMSWCRKQKLVEHNPCDDLDRDERPQSASSRDHVPTIDELRAVWNAVENEPQRDLVRFLLLVPLRRDEAAGLMWSEIDLPLRRIRISASRAKTREAHELPLSAPAMALLEARSAKGELVFPNADGKPYNGFDSLLTRIRARIGHADTKKAERFSFHDVRRAFVSHLAERGYDVDLLDQCLGHSRQGVLGVYQRASRMAERARALETWASLVTGAGEAEKGGFWSFSQG